MRPANHIVIPGQARAACASQVENPAQNVPKAHDCVCDKSYAGSPNILAGAQTFEDDEA
jgi:hypothetical protein